MRERKYIKFRVDMHEDTKFKIIDRMPKRDLIHYVWNRFVLLAGKVNKEGDLYMSKNIPYTVETLSIEFNRDIDEIKAALDVLMELEMMELSEDKVYRVKNFAKHQNIKVKEKIEVKEKENNVKHVENNTIENKIQTKDGKNEITENEVQTEELENEDYIKDNEEINDKADKFDVIPLLDYVEVNSNDVNKSDDKNDNKENEKIITSQHNNTPVILEMKKQKTNRKNKKAKKNKIRDDNIEEKDNSLIDIMEDDDGVAWNAEDEKETGEVCFWSNEEVISLKDGERMVSQWEF